MLLTFLELPPYFSSAGSNEAPLAAIVARRAEEQMME